MLECVRQAELRIAGTNFMYVSSTLSLLPSFVRSFIPSVVFGDLLSDCSGFELQGVLANGGKCGLQRPQHEIGVWRRS